MYSPAKSSALTMTSQDALYLASNTQFSRLLTVPLDYLATWTVEFSITLTYHGT